VDAPVIQGTITELKRGTLAHGPVFEAVVERIAALFSSYSLPELEQAKLAMAPVEWVVNLDPLLERLDPLAKEWKPGMLRQFDTELPTNTSLAIYGRGPGWLYGTLAAQAEPQPFYQFDPRIGWLSPPSLRISNQPPPEGIVVHLREHQNKDALILSVHIANEYLDYLQAEQFPFPPVPLEHGLILDGKIPYWLLTALVRLYDSTEVAWIACHQPQLKSAVVVTSHVKAHTIGEVIPMLIP
jgi:CRISPR-associated protein Csx3